MGRQPEYRLREENSCCVCRCLFHFVQVLSHYPEVMSLAWRAKKRTLIQTYIFRKLLKYMC